MFTFYAAEKCDFPDFLINFFVPIISRIWHVQKFPKFYCNQDYLSYTLDEDVLLKPRRNFCVNIFTPRIIYLSKQVKNKMIQLPWFVSIDDMLDGQKPVGSQYFHPNRYGHQTQKGFAYRK